MKGRTGMEKNGTLNTHRTHDTHNTHDMHDTQAHDRIHTSRRTGLRVGLLTLLAGLLALSLSLGGLVGCSGSGSTGASNDIGPGTTDQPGPTGETTPPTDPGPEETANPFEEASYRPTTTEKNAALVSLFSPPSAATLIEEHNEPGDYEWLVEGPFNEIASGIVSIYTGASISDLTPSFMKEIVSMGMTSSEGLSMPEGTPGGPALTGTGWTLWGFYEGDYFELTIQDASGFYDNEDGQYHERTFLYIFYGK